MVVAMAIVAALFFLLDQILKFFLEMVLSMVFSYEKLVYYSITLKL